MDIVCLAGSLVSLYTAARLDPTLPSASLGARAVDGRTCVRREVQEVKLDGLSQAGCVGFVGSEAMLHGVGFTDFCKTFSSECRCTRMHAVGPGPLLAVFLLGMEGAVVCGVMVQWYVG